jgi:hypothetical protein
MEVSIPWHWFLWLPSNLRFCNREYRWTVEICKLLRINKLLSKVNKSSWRRKHLNFFFKFKHPNRMHTIEFKVSYVYVNTRDSYHLSQNSTFRSLRAWPSRHIQYSMLVHLVNYKYINLYFKLRNRRCSLCRHESHIGYLVSAAAIDLRSVQMLRREAGIRSNAKQHYQ